MLGLAEGGEGVSNILTEYVESSWSWVLSIERERTTRSKEASTDLQDFLRDVASVKFHYHREFVVWPYIALQ